MGLLLDGVKVYTNEVTWHCLKNAVYSKTIWSIQIYLKIMQGFKPIKINFLKLLHFNLQQNFNTIFCVCPKLIIQDTIISQSILITTASSPKSYSKILEMFQQLYSKKLFKFCVLYSTWSICTNAPSGICFYNYAK